MCSCNTTEKNESVSLFLDAGYTVQIELPGESDIITYEFKKKDYYNENKKIYMNLNVVFRVKKDKEKNYIIDGKIVLGNEERTIYLNDIKFDEKDDEYYELFKKILSQIGITEKEFNSMILKISNSL